MEKMPWHPSGMPTASSLDLNHPKQVIGLFLFLLKAEPAFASHDFKRLVQRSEPHETDNEIRNAVNQIVGNTRDTERECRFPSAEETPKSAYETGRHIRSKSSRSKGVVKVAFSLMGPQSNSYILLVGSTFEPVCTAGESNTTGL